MRMRMLTGVLSMLVGGIAGIGVAGCETAPLTGETNAQGSEEGAAMKLTASTALSPGSLVGATAAAPVPALVVITTNALNSSPMMAAYVAFKRQVRPTYVVTENKTFLADGVIDANHGWADGLDLSQPPSYLTSSARADAIRHWLQLHYLPLGIGSALLVGDPNPHGGEIPMKKTYLYKHYQDVAAAWTPAWTWQPWDPADDWLGMIRVNCLTPGDPDTYANCQAWRDPHNPNDTDTAIPTDYYYSNLTYTWPLDADGDIANITETNFGTQDIHVGRLPVYGNDIASMNKILGKFISYTTSADKAWRKNALLAMGTHGGSNGEYAIFGESIRNRILTPSGFGATRLYTPCHSVPGLTCDITGDSALSLVNVGSAWAGTAWPGCFGPMCTTPKQNFGVVVWGAHGWPTGSSDVITLDDAALNYAVNLDDSHPAFTFGVSCSNSNPHVSNNLNTTLLENGAIATVGATRVSSPAWGEWGANPGTISASSTDVAFGYIKGLVTNGLPAGAALSAARTQLWRDILSLMPIPDKVASRANWIAWDQINVFKSQLLMFNLYGDPTIGLENQLNPAVIKLPKDTPVNVSLAPGQKTTLYADDWPSKDDPWWTANIVLALNSLTGSPIPSGSIQVNGISYPIVGGQYYQEINIPDEGPYTIVVTTSAAASIQIILGNR